jgi:endonuclease G
LTYIRKIDIIFIMNNIKKLMFLLVLFIASYANADAGACNSMFPEGHEPVVSKTNTRELCFNEFFVLYSVESKTPIYSVQKLNHTELNGHENRTNHFHEELKLKESERATLADFAHSGYDRGHMSPAATMKNSVAMEESFSLCNMVLQSPKNNRGLWAKSVEKATYKYAMRAQGDVYVFTGPYFKPNHKIVGIHNVWVPDYLFKLVFDKTTGRSWVFWVENSDDAKMSAPISYDEFVSRTGMHLLQ